MSENYIMLNGKRVDLTDEQIEKLGIKTNNLSECFKPKFGNKYFYIDRIGVVAITEDVHAKLDAKLYDVANYCTDKELLQQRAYHETLSRLLWRFSMQNDGDKMMWDYHDKYTIAFDFKDKKFHICSTWTAKYLEPYFYSKEIAQRAIDKIILPFMKEHPDFVW